MEIGAADVEAVDMAGDHAEEEEETVYEGVGVGACEEEHGEGGKDDVD